MDWRAQHDAAAKPVVWTGDLERDCIAYWAGLVLHAQKQSDDPDEGWWWTVCAFETEEELAHSGAYDPPIGTKSGASARAAAEWAARRLVFPNAGL